MKVYVDTSVYGGYYDEEFREPTREFFRRTRNGWFTLVWSDLLEKEIKQAPPQVRRLFGQLTRRSDSLKVLIIPGVVELAKAYLDAGVLPEKMRNDALHVALATHYQTTYLASWDSKHIVEPARIVGFQQVNLALGFGPVSIVNPAALL